MEVNQLQTLATELAKSLKTPEALNQFSRFLKKLTVQTAVMGTQARGLSAAKGPWNCGLLGIVKGHSSLNELKKIKRVLPAWISRYSRYTRKG